MSRIVSSAVLVLAFFFSVGNASAHTTAIGYVNNGPGSVTFWYKSWHSFTPPFFEGSFNLVGVNGNPFPDTTVPFDQSFGGNGMRPPGLIDGVNLFYACTSNGLCPTDEDGNGGDKWQGVTFNNLIIGSYVFTYLPIANPSADWAPANEEVRTGTLDLDASVIGGSQPIPTLNPVHLMLLVLGLIGVTAAIRRRRFSK
jgi:fibronectin-binding autotransporter adhesin